jgi:hypothetical protein
MASSGRDYSPAPSPRLPPPPPTPHHPHFHTPQISPRRFAVQPPLLNTTLAPPHQQQQQHQHQHQHHPQQHGSAYLHGSLPTPATATSLNVPYSPLPTPSTYAPSPVAVSSPMAMRGAGSAVPYNPQQWSRSGGVGGQHVQHSQTSVPTRLQDVTGMEGTYHTLLASNTLSYVVDQMHFLALLLVYNMDRVVSKPFIAWCIAPTSLDDCSRDSRHASISDADCF